MPKRKKLLSEVLIIIIAILVIGIILSTSLKPKEQEFKLPDSFISLQGPIIAVKPGGCNQGYLRSEDLITKNDCGQIFIPQYGINMDNYAPCIRIPLSLINYMGFNETTKQEYGWFTNNLVCGGKIGKPYCQIKMDNKIIVKEGCFDTGLEAITSYSEKPIELNRTHTFLICCSATDKKSSFDICKSFTMEKIC